MLKPFDRRAEVIGFLEPETDDGAAAWCSLDRQGLTWVGII